MKSKSTSILLPGKIRSGRLDISAQLQAANITGESVAPVLELIQAKVTSAIQGVLAPDELIKVRDEAAVSFYRELTIARQKLAQTEAATQGGAAKGSNA